MDEQKKFTGIPLTETVHVHVPVPQGFVPDAVFAQVDGQRVDVTKTPTGFTIRNPTDQPMHVTGVAFGHIARATAEESNDDAGDMRDVILSSGKLAFSDDDDDDNDVRGDDAETEAMKACWHELSAFDARTRARMLTWLDSRSRAHQDARAYATATATMTGACIVQPKP